MKNCANFSFLIVLKMILWFTKFGDVNRKKNDIRQNNHDSVVSQDVFLYHKLADMYCKSI